MTRGFTPTPERGVSRLRGRAAAAPRLVRGFTLFEVLIAAFFAIILGGIAVVNLGGRARSVELRSTAERISALLREAQSRSVNQASSTNWGVHFENGTGTPFFALYFSDAYSASTSAGTYPLPARVGYATASIAVGSSKNISFRQITGTATASTSVTILLLSDPGVSSTVGVASSGAVIY